MALIGSVVHDALTTCVQALRSGAPLPTTDALRGAAAYQLNRTWLSSRRNLRAFLAHPSSVADPMLQEALYGVEVGPSAIQGARSRLEASLCALVGCEGLWEDVRSASPGDVIIVDKFYSFPLHLPGSAESLQVFAAPDLIVRARPDAPWIITDLKTGGADGVVDQLLTYALAARDGLGLSSVAGVCGQIIALGADPAERVTQFAISASDVDGAARRIGENVVTLRRLVADPRTNTPVPLSEVPRARDIARCRWCAHRGGCWPDRFPMRHDEVGMATLARA